MAKQIILILLILSAAVAVVFRVADLGRRPMHADESVQAAIARDLWLEGEYSYNPDEFHGPTMPYATLPVLWLSGAESFAETTEATYRTVPVIFGIAVVLFMWFFADAVGWPAAFSASLLAAVSPAMVFYSRYYIHEMLLVFFTMCVALFGWRYLRSYRLAWCLAAGACIGLMQATKETAPLNFAAAVGALALTWLYAFCPGLPRTNPKRERGTEDDEGAGRSSPALRIGVNLSRLRWWHLTFGVVASLVVAALFYSSFLSNPRGLINAALTYEPWLKRAGGESPHGNPWYFFLQRLGWWRLEDGPLFSELLTMVLAAFGFFAALLPQGRLLRDGSIHFVRWLGCYTLLLMALYSIIPYKTPWCVLQFLWGMILLAGVGAVVLVRAVPTIPGKTLVTVALLAGAGQLAWQSCEANFVMPADPENPWVFAHTSPGLLDLESIVEGFAAAHPEGHALPIKVVWHDHYYWPLPWHLRRFEHVEFWTSVPDDPDAAVVISSPKFDKELTAALGETHLMTGFYEIRPQVLAQLWVREDVWVAHLRALGRI